MINEKRLVEEFINLVKIDSESRNEAKVAANLKEQLTPLASDIVFDNASKAVGGNCNNLIAHVPGTLNKDMIMVCAHMDTVKPGIGIKPQIEGDIIKSDGTTILGSDDKSGIAVIIETLRTLKEKNIPHRPVEVVFTVSEEEGLVGAKNLDYSLLQAKMGLALDDHAVGDFTIGAPAKSTIEIKVHGLESHAGVEPEKGISAIVVASKAIAQLKLGRVSPNTVSNIGKMISDFSTNVVPNLVEIKAEARSLDNQELADQIEHIKTTFEKTAASTVVEKDGKHITARAEIKVTPSYAAFVLKEKDPIYQLAKQASESLGFKPKFTVGLGGTDANHFNQHGINVIMMGTGMESVHTKSEHISISQMVKSAELLLKILTM
ncbi:MAG: M20/M25/M40 family metallo-hydrolase [Planctomycetota bacterium]